MTQTGDPTITLDGQYGEGKENMTAFEMAENVRDMDVEQYEEFNERVYSVSVSA